jgi:hypothetical protein
MAETAELDTKNEAAPSPNGHDEKWQSFDTDDALLQHIISKKPAEELVEVPEWNVKILCRALNAKDRFEIQALSSNEKTQRYDYLPHLHLAVIAGCYNPVTGNKVFNDNHKDALRQANGEIIARLALTILRLSHMLSNDVEDAKKN